MSNSLTSISPFWGAVNVLSNTILLGRAAYKRSQATVVDEKTKNLGPASLSNKRRLIRNHIARLRASEIFRLPASRTGIEPVSPPLKKKRFVGIQRKPAAWKHRKGSHRDSKGSLMGASWAKASLSIQHRLTFPSRKQTNTSRKQGTTA